MEMLKVFGLAESMLLTGETYYFMSRARREIYLKKPYYVIAFLLYGIFVETAGAVIQDDRITLALWIPVGILMGYVLFSRKMTAAFYNMILIISWYLCQLIAQIGMLEWCSYQGRMPDEQVMLSISVLRIMLEVVVTIGMTTLVQQRQIVKISKMQYVSMFLMPIFSIIFVISLLTMGGTYVALYGMGLFLFNMILLVCLNVYYILLFAKISRTNELQNELRLFQNQSELQYRYYSELETKYQESRKMVHDMRNHLHAMEQLYEERETQPAKQYVQDIHEMLNQMGQKYYTSSRMLNIILNDKAKRAGREHVAMDIRIGDISLEGIRDVDITTIFANVLDNAIEAAAKAEHGFVEIKADYVQEFLVVKISNAKPAGNYKKTGHMGVGLENVRRTLERYFGDMQTEEAENIFRTVITIPKGEILKGEILKGETSESETSEGEKG